MSDTPRLQDALVDWLAEVFANDGLVRRAPPDGVTSKEWKHVEAHSKLPPREECFHAEPLSEEPRSLAVKQGCQEIAIGGKQGQIVRLRRQADVGWSSQHLHHTPSGWAEIAEKEEKEEKEEKDNHVDAIRAIRFDHFGRLVAGEGLGTVHVLPALDAGADAAAKEGPLRGATSSLRATPEWGASDSDDLKAQAWAGRFSKLVGLHATLTEPDVPDLQLLALGTTEVDQIYLIQQRDGGPVRVIPTLPWGTVTIGGRERPLLQGWPEHVRLVDGTWSRGSLWLLDCAGNLRCYKPHKDPKDQNSSGAHGDENTQNSIDAPQANNTQNTDDPSHVPPVFEPKLLPLRGERLPGEDVDAYRALVACHWGLLVRRQRSVEFWGYPWLSSKVPNSAEDSNPATDTLPLRYRVPFPHAFDAAVSIPIKMLEDHVPEDVELVASVPQMGLLRLALTDASRRPRELSLGDRPADKEVDVLHVRFGSDKELQGPTWLITTHRDPHVEIAAVAHVAGLSELLNIHLRGRVRAHLKSAMEKRSSENEDELRRAALASLPTGTRWWLLQTLIKEDFGPPELARVLGEQPPMPLRDHLTQTLDRRELTRMMDAVFEAWSASPEPDKAVTTFKDWVRRLLGRARAIDPEVLTEVAQRCCTRIEAERTPLNADDPEEAKKASQRWGLLAVFHGFLTKWILAGVVFQEKTQDIWGLYKSNRENGHDLEALTYLSRLMSERVDMCWSHRSPPERGPVWSLAASEKQRFVVASFRSGEVRALDTESGAWLEWHRQDSVPAGATLQLVPNAAAAARGFGMRHPDAKMFHDTYHHGPYARSVLVQDLQDGSSLIALCTKGWRAEDRPEQGDTAPAPSHSGAPVLWLMRVELDAQTKTLEIKWGHAASLESEIYGMCSLSDTAEGSSGQPERWQVLAGTSGRWGDTATPIVQLQVVWSQATKPVQVKPGPQAAGHRASWSLSTQKRAPGGKTWSMATVEVPASNPPGGASRLLLVGNQAGSAHLYVQADDAWREQKVRSVVTQGSHDRQTLALQSAGAIWCMQALNHGDGDTPARIAYGTAGGQYGVLELRMEGDVCDVVHLLHSQADASVCSLQHYTDEGVEVLAALSQGGVLYLHRLSDEASPAGDKDKPRRPRAGERLDRINVGGNARTSLYWTDSEPQPRLILADASGDLRCVAVQLPHESERRRMIAAALLPSCSYAQGQDSPCFSWEERWQWAGDGARLEDAAAAPSLLQVLRPKDDDEEVGALPKTVLSWLHVLHPGGTHVLRFALYFELKVQREVLAEALASYANGGCIGLPGILVQTRHMCDTMHRLSQEVLQLRPPSRDLAKVIWEQGSRVANEVAAVAVERLLNGDQSTCEQLLICYELLNAQVDRLCNRWIGEERQAEGKVLMHSFQHQLDWTDLVLLGLEPTPSSDDPEATKNLRKVRKLTLERVQRRLGFSDSVVHLEALRVLNLGLSRACEWQKGRVDQGKARPQMALRHLRGDPTDGAGLLDLCMLVGQVGRRLVSEGGPGSPLASALAQFFALMLTLTGPRSARVVGHVYCESYLNSLQVNINQELRQQLRRLGEYQEDKEALEDIVKAFMTAPPMPRDPPDAHGLPSQEPFTSAEYEDEEAQRYFEVRESSPRGVPSFTSAEYERAQHYVLSQLRALSELHGARLPANPETPDAAKHYFERSLDHIQFMDHLRGWIRSLLEPAGQMKDSLNGGSSELLNALFNEPLSEAEAQLKAALSEAEAPISEALSDPRLALNTPEQRALEICRIEERLLLQGTRGLFEPEVSLFIQVLDEWAKAIHQELNLGWQLISTLEKYFRHVHRTSADSLLSSVTDLAIMVAPIRLPRERPTTLRERLLDALHGHPLVYQIFYGTHRVVESTRLTATLLLAAGKGRMRTDSQDVGTITLGELLREAARACEREALGLRVVLVQGDRSEVMIQHKPNAHQRPSDLVEGVLNNAGRQADLSTALPIKGGHWLWPTVLQELATNVRRYAMTSQRPATEEAGRSTEEAEPFVVAIELKSSNPAEPYQARSIWFGGGLPMMCTIADNRWKDVERKSPDVDAPLKPLSEQVGALQRLAAATANEHERLNPQRDARDFIKESTGMGLTMLTQICKLAGLTGQPSLMLLPREGETGPFRLSTPSDAQLSEEKEALLKTFIERGRLCFEVQLPAAGGPS